MPTKEKVRCDWSCWLLLVSAICSIMVVIFGLRYNILAITILGGILLIPSWLIILLEIHAWRKWKSKPKHAESPYWIHPF